MFTFLVVSSQRTVNNDSHFHLEIRIEMQYLCKTDKSIE